MDLVYAMCRGEWDMDLRLSPPEFGLKFNVVTAVLLKHLHGSCQSAQRERAEVLTMPAVAHETVRISISGYRRWKGEIHAF